MWLCGRRSEANGSSLPIFGTTASRYVAARPRRRGDRIDQPRGPVLPHRSRQLSSARRSGASAPAAAPAPLAATWPPRRRARREIRAASCPAPSSEPPKTSTSQKVRGGHSSYRFSHLLAETASYKAQQLHRAIRLSHVLIATRRARLLLVPLHRKRADRNNWRFLQIGVGLDL